MYYERLKKATPKELLEAAIRVYGQDQARGFFNYAVRANEVESLLRLGFALAQPDGWQHIAPAWLDEHGGKHDG